jgi:hypothetical protein
MKYLYILLFISLIIVAYFLSPRLTRSSSTLNKEITEGEYIQLVYMGSSTCGYCSDSLHLSLSNLKNEFSKLSEQGSIRFYSTGISADIDPDIGYNFLKKSGPYDEFIIGGSWYNMGFERYVWNKFGLEGFIPKILILKLNFNTKSGTQGIMNIERMDTLLFELNSIEDLKKFDIEKVLNN